MAIFDRVKFDGLSSRDWIIYKHPSETLVIGTQLIVNEGQVAVFLKGGRICDIFPPGTYTLDTANLPILNSIINIPFGGKTPFTAEIYYINTVTKLDMQWGTSDPIQIIDPKYFIRLRVRAFGQLGLKISDYTTFITELVGSLSQADLVKFDKVMGYYKGVLVSKVKSIIADVIINQKISALEISAKLDDISNRTLETLAPEFSKFGFEIVNFFIKSINFPDEDFDQINKILEDKAAFEIMGDNRYATKRSFDIYEDAASNDSGVAGAFVAGGVGLGAGMTIGNQFGNNVNQVLNNTPSDTVVYCPKCKTAVKAGSKFCNECGYSLQKKICECGNVLEANSKFCNNCGRKVDDSL